MRRFYLTVHYQSGRTERHAYDTQRKRDAAIREFEKLPTVVRTEKA